ncbi:MAG: acyltransferase family protein [Candidatus Binataceae bacterium]
MTARASIHLPPTAPRPARNLALGYLRGFLVVLVLAHHSVLAYYKAAPRIPKSMLAAPQSWRAFPVVDPSAHWVGFNLFFGFNDAFFMALMFFVSGLFVCTSVGRKGARTFVHDRLIRLGIPFLAAAGIVAPIAYYPAYLQSGGHGLSRYVHAWRSLGDWPAGPAWFIWMLLAFDLIAAAGFSLMPNLGAVIGGLASNAREHPIRFFLVFTGSAIAVYLPMSFIHGAGYWTSIGVFQFQTSRVFLYAVYFFAGIAVGAYGIARGLLAADGIFARHWDRWVVWGLLTFVLSVIFFFVTLALQDTVAPALLEILSGCVYAITSTSLSFGFMALFIRFANHQRAIWDSLSDNGYAMYLLHYMFVTWIQFALIALAIPAIGKGVLVFAAVLALSWGTSAAIRSIPGVARVV